MLFSLDNFNLELPTCCWSTSGTYKQQPGINFTYFLSLVTEAQLLCTVKHTTYSILHLHNLLSGLSSAFSIWYQKQWNRHLRLCVLSYNITQVSISAFLALIIRFKRFYKHQMAQSLQHSKPCMTPILKHFSSAAEYYVRQSSRSLCSVFSEILSNKFQLISSKSNSLFRDRAKQIAFEKFFFI